MFKNNFVLMLTTPQLDERHIEAIMEKADVNRQQATRALANSKNNIFVAYMDLTEPNG